MSSTRQNPPPPPFSKRGIPPFEREGRRDFLEAGQSNPPLSPCRCKKTPLIIPPFSPPSRGREFLKTLEVVQSLPLKRIKGDRIATTYLRINPSKDPILFAQ
jgi:hypothetical protein